MVNTHVYTTFNGEKFLKNTGNKYELVAQRPFKDKKGILSDGVTVTLHILQDNGDYGIDKNTGKKRNTNKGQNFDATILCGTQSLDIEQGEHVSLIGFDIDNSLVIGFDQYLRFKGIKKTGASNSAPSTTQASLSKGFGVTGNGGTLNAKKLG
ncbi:MAG: hypothetical protein OSJ60_11125 [Lachnospiraceae bacterium]|nr:hypothetical protein [Lachnospiraceae bacterium]